MQWNFSTKWRKFFKQIWNSNRKKKISRSAPSRVFCGVALGSLVKEEEKKNWHKHTRKQNIFFPLLKVESLFVYDLTWKYPTFHNSDNFIKLVWPFETSFWKVTKQNIKNKTNKYFPQYKFQMYLHFNFHKNEIGFSFRTMKNALSCQFQFESVSSKQTQYKSIKFVCYLWLRSLLYNNSNRIFDSYAREKKAYEHFR